MLARKIFDPIVPRKCKAPEQHIEDTRVNIDASPFTSPLEFNFSEP